jgi:thiol-disulfide isomerase/thioredoxin
MKNTVKVACAAIACMALAVQAQSVQAPIPLAPLQASTLTGARFDQQQLSGKVAIVYFWSTACAVCRDSLPELRTNQAGWRNKPFALVTVNVDRNSEDWQTYERILAKTRPASAGLITLRQDSGIAPPGKLPLTLLVDAKGKVVARYEGRLAPEAWDGVADLMP